MVMKEETYKKPGPSHREPANVGYAHPDTSIHRGLEPPNVDGILESVNMDYRKQLKQRDHEPHEAMYQHSEADIKRSLPSDTFVKYGDGMSKHDDAHYGNR